MFKKLLVPLLIVIIVITIITIVIIYSYNYNSTHTPPHTHTISLIKEIQEKPFHILKISLYRRRAGREGWGGVKYIISLK